MADANTRSAIQIATQPPPNQKEMPPHKVNMTGALRLQLVLPWANSCVKPWVPQMDTIRPQSRAVDAMSTRVGECLGMT